MQMLKRGKRIVKYIGIVFLMFLLLAGLYMISAFVLSSIEVKAEPESTHDVSIFVLTNGVHADLVVPVKTEQMDWSRLIKYEHTLRKDTMAQYVALGWGDKEFYIETPTWADLKFKTAYSSIFGLNTAAIHTTFYKRMQASSTCLELHLNHDQYKRLITYIENSFVTDENGKYIPISPPVYYGEDDTFYEAHGRYHLFYTSNTWTNDGLKACGQKASLWTPFDKGIFYHYHKQENKKKRKSPE